MDRVYGLAHPPFYNFINGQLRTSMWVKHCKDICSFLRVTAASIVVKCTLTFVISIVANCTGKALHGKDIFQNRLPYKVLQHKHPVEDFL